MSCFRPHLEPHFSQLLSVLPSKIALKILLFLSVPTATPRFQAIIISSLDYCNSLLTGLSASNLPWFQTIFQAVIFINVTVWFIENFVWLGNLLRNYPVLCFPLLQLVRKRWKAFFHFPGEAARAVCSKERCNRVAFSRMSAGLARELG